MVPQVKKVTSAMFDLILRGGHLVDASQGIDARRDVAFSGGKVAAIRERIDDVAHDTRDITGLFVAPGLIDLHSHAVDQPRLNDPFARTQAFDVDASVGSARCNAGKAIAMSACVDHGFRDWLACEMADDCSFGAKVRQNEILGRQATPDAGSHFE